MLVLAVLALGTLASAQTFGFGTSIGGSGLYCNYEQLFYYGGALWAGEDNLSACPYAPVGYSAAAGFGASVPNVGPAAHGKGVVYGDSIYAAYDGIAEAQWTVFTKLKCNKVSKTGVYTGTDGWEGVAGFYGFFGGTNAGPLSCNIPAKNGVKATKGANMRQSNGAHRK